MNPVRTTQRGQALVEALLIVPMLIVAFLAVAWIGKLQFSAQEMAQLSRRAVMAAASGAPVASPQTGASVAGRAQAMAGGMASANAALQNEWFGAELRLMSVSAQTAVAGTARWDAARIQRRTSVATGAGHADGDDDARRRVGAAPTSWGRAANRSLSLARSVGGAVGRVDAPWGRPAISTDWLSPWADLVPADRVGKRRKAYR